MRYSAGIVFRESCIQIVGDSGIEMPPCEAFKDVDKFHEFQTWLVLLISEYIVHAEGEGLFELGWPAEP
jgi:hypothetical protein